MVEGVEQGMAEQLRPEGVLAFGGALEGEGTYVPSVEERAAGESLQVNIAIRVAYDGTPFNGFAKQPGQLTVQGDLEEALALIFRHPVETVCAGRTDSGVHARCQWVGFTLSASEWEGRTEHKLLKSLNALTHDGISVHEVVRKDLDFSVRFSARSREYRYFVCTDVAAPLLMSKFSWHLGRQLDIEAMREGASYLIGELDFRSFCLRASAEGKNTYRNVASITVEPLEMWGEHLVCITVIGNAFLHSMVRTIVGTLVLVGLGKREPAWVGEVLEARNRSAAGENAPANGLVFWKVNYDGPILYDPLARTGEFAPEPAPAEGTESVEEAEAAPIAEVEPEDVAAVASEPEDDAEPETAPDADPDPEPKPEPEPEAERYGFFAERVARLMNNPDAEIDIPRGMPREAGSKAVVGPALVNAGVYGEVEWNVDEVSTSWDPNAVRAFTDETGVIPAIDENGNPVDLEALLLSAYAVPEDDEPAPEEEPESAPASAPESLPFDSLGAPEFDAEGTGSWEPDLGDEAPAEGGNDALITSVIRTFISAAPLPEPNAEPNAEASVEPSAVSQPEPGNQAEMPNDSDEGADSVEEGSIAAVQDTEEAMDDDEPGPETIGRLRKKYPFER
jgi:tRNA pseudouridine38-40 synthase